MDLPCPSSSQRLPCSPEFVGLVSRLRLLHSHLSLQLSFLLSFSTSRNPFVTMRATCVISVTFRSPTFLVCLLSHILNSFTNSDITFSSHRHTIPSYLLHQTCFPPILSQFNTHTALAINSLTFLFSTVSYPIFLIISSGKH